MTSLVRFSLDFRNNLNLPTKVTIDLNQQNLQEYCLIPGFNTLQYISIDKKGENKLTLCFTDPIYAEFLDLRVHGNSINKNILDSKMFINDIESPLSALIVTDSRWEWYFLGPIIENKKIRVGIW